MTIRLSSRVENSVSDLSPELAKASDSRLRVIADVLPAYIAYIDNDLRYVMANRTYEEWFGRTASEIVGRPVAEVLGPSFANIQPHLQGALAGTTQRFETRMSTVDGERYLSVVHVPDRDEHGEVRGIIVHGHDVTDRRRIEEQLRASEERLRLALSAANGVGTWDWDVVNNLLYSDETFARLYGVDPLQATSGVALAEFTRRVHPEDIPRVRDAMNQSIQSNEEFSSEYRLVGTDRTIRWVSARGRCTHNADGTPIRFPGIVIDITERKIRDEALLQTEKLAAVGRLASSGVPDLLCRWMS